MSKFNIFEKNIRKLFKLKKISNKLINLQKNKIFPLIRLSLFRAEYENDIKKLITNNIFSKY